jgi:hypothetical protein
MMSTTAAALLPGALDLFVVGSPYSGSTLLANALNGHDLIANAGEVSACFAEFPFGVKTPFCPLCGAAAEPCPVWTPDFIAQVLHAGPSRALALFRQRVGSPVVVDSSKFPDWLALAWNQGGAPSSVAPVVPVPTGVIVIARNPLAYHASNRRRTGASAWTSVKEWVHCYQTALEWLDEHETMRHLMTYESLAQQPEVALKRVVETFGLSWDEHMLHFWNKPMHALNGNAGAYMWYPGFAHRAEFERAEDVGAAAAYVERPFGGWVDDKWYGACTDADIDAMLTGVPGQALRRLCGEFGYDLDQLIDQARCRTRAGRAAALAVNLI